MNDALKTLENTDDPEIKRKIQELAEEVEAKNSLKKESDKGEGDKEFDTKRKIKFAISFVVSIAVSYFTFNYATMLFGFSIALTIILFSLIAYEWLDEVYFKQNTIYRIGENSIALAIHYFALIILFIASFYFGDRWIGGQSNLSIEENRTIQAEQQPVYPTGDSVTPPVRIELRGGDREPTLK